MEGGKREGEREKEGYEKLKEAGNFSKSFLLPTQIMFFFLNNRDQIDLGIHPQGR